MKQVSEPAKIGVLFDYAVRFRRALDTFPRNELPPYLQNFPRGSCGVTASLLARYLRERGMDVFDFVSAEKGRRGRDWHSHTWLEQDGVVVDITADQFPDVSEPVIVAVRSPWHRRYRVRRQHPDFFGTAPPNGGTERDMEAIYPRLAALADAVGAGEPRPLSCES